MKRGNNSLKLMKDYINILDNLENTKKTELYKLDSNHYINIINGIALLQTTYWSEPTDYEIYFNKGLKHVENSKYKKTMGG